MSKRLAVLAALAAGALGSAHAIDVRFTGWAAGSSVGVTVADNGNPGLTLANGNASMVTKAGGFNTTLSNNPGGLTGSFVSYCVDLGQYLSFNTTYTTQYAVGDAQTYFGAKYDDALQLFSYAYATSTSSAESSAGFQIALWEVLYENSGSYDLGTGGISFTNSAALDEAAAFLSGMASYNGPDANLQVLTSGTKQDVAFAAPVPEPSTYALMIAGLAAVGFVARRRRGATT